MEDNKKLLNDIAIVGMACRFPNANNYKEFWNNLVNGLDCVSEIDNKRWDSSRFYSAKQEDGKSISKWCGLVEKMEYFDNQFFRISPREALVMDPHQRNLLEVSWQCIEDSGIGLKQLQNNITDVYTNVSHNDYGHRVYAKPKEIDGYSNLGNVASISANRISYCFGLRGISMAIDAACASSLVAINEGCRALYMGDCNYALIGSANFVLHQSRFISYSKARMLSSDGRCKTFDMTANGFVPGEGVGVLLLQRLEDAVKENNHVYAVIKASVVSQIGGKDSITAPKMQEQKKLILSAYSRCDFTPETVGYIEAHGTGTALGDPIEIEALKQAFSEYTNKKQFCKIGSVKTNIGHLEGTAGMAGVIKAVLMMNAHKIPKSLNLKDLNPIIDFANSPFEVATACTDWNPINKSLLLRAGVSAYGFGGAGGHILLEEYLGNKSSPKCETMNNIFTLSAKTEISLDKTIQKWREFTKTSDFSILSLQDICATSTWSRSDFRFRIGFNVKEKKDLVNKLTDLKYNALPQKYNKVVMQIGTLKLLGFFEVTQLYYEQPEFRNSINSFKIMLDDDEWSELFNDIWKEQNKKLYTFIVHYALIKVLDRVGIKVNTVVASGEGTWPFLVYSGIVSKKNAIMVIKNKINYNNLEFFKPKINLYDGFRQRMLLPMKLKMSNFDYINSSMKIDLNEIQNSFLEKAEKVYSNIYTYKKIVQEWKNIISDLEFDEVINVVTKRLDIKNAENINLTLFILISSMQRLSRKWDLNNQEINCCGKKFNEIMQLYNDGILAKTDICNIFSHNNSLRNSTVYTEYTELNDKRTISDKNREVIEGEGDFKEWITGMIKNDTLYKTQDDEMLIKIDREYQEIKQAYNLKEVFNNILLDTWCNGFNIEMKSIYNVNSFHKVALPVYEFDRKPYLLSNILDNCEVGSTVTKERGIKSKKIKEIDVNDTIIKDHKIIDRILVPAATFIQFAMDQVVSVDTNVNKLTRVIFLRPCEVKDEQKLFFNDKSGEFSIQSSRDVFCKGEYGREIFDSIPPINFDGLNNYPELENHKVYKILSKLGYLYGKSLRVIKKIWMLNGGYIAQLSEFEYENKEKISSALLDGIIQSILAVELLEDGLDSTGMIYIPFKINEISFNGELHGGCYVVIHKSRIEKVNGDLLASVSVYHYNGKPLVSINRLCLKGCEKNFLQKNKNEDIFLNQVLCYETVWIEQSEIISAEQINSKTAIIYILQSYEKNIYKTLYDNYKRVVLIQAGETFSEEKDKFIINPLKIDDLINVFDRLDDKKQEYDLYCLGTNNEPILAESYESIKKCLNSKVHYFFNLCKAALMKRIGKKLNIFIPVTNSQIVTESDYCWNFIWGGLESLARTIKQENSKVNMSVIDFEFEDIEKQIDIILRDFPAIRSQPLVAYRGEQRFIRGLKTKQLNSNISSVDIDKEDTYIIAGGMGGVGYSIVEALSKLEKTNLIIVGSSELNKEKKDRIDKLNKYKSKVVYFQCDITHRLEMMHMVEAIKQQYGDIRGVIQCAGKTDDQLMMNKKWECFYDVIESKILGTFILNEITQKEPLKFFLVFSSIVSVIGNIGQSDYAYGNGVLDSFIEYREKNGYPGKSICINWTLWENLGMGANSSAIKNFSHKTGGIKSDVATKICFDILKKGFRQTLIVENSDTAKEYLRKIFNVSGENI